MIRFFAPDIENTLTLPESDSQHCVRVLRMQIGDEIQVIDGKGSAFTCRIVDAHPKRTLVTIVSKTSEPLPWDYHITLAIAPTKHMDRMEWLVEKATEIGVNRIAILRCRFSERKEIKRERLEKIAVSAMKQSLKSYLPEITETIPFKDFITANRSGQKFIAYCDAETERKELCKSIVPDNDCSILIGPEGDFSPEEVSAALENGWTPVTLGDTRLRTETAAIVGLDTIHIINQYLKH